VRVPAQSHRTAAYPLKPGLGFKKDEEADKKDEPAPAADPNAGQQNQNQYQFGPGQATTGAGDERGGRGAPSAASLTAVYGLDRNRYLAATEQCRHLPVAMVLVIDQAYLTDLLTSLANSRLRFQITQVHYHRARGVQPGGSGGASNGPRGTPGNERPQPGQVGNYGAAAVGDGEPNLIEVTIYGIAALYERYSEKKDDKKDETPAK
jgi:hypothetical protein